MGCIDQREEKDGSISCIPSGPILSWLAFGYDLLCLFHKNILPKKLINRLKHPREFQGAWFEVAAAATILRSGCDIKWITDKSKRNCEFIATHRSTNINFGVEAKSKRRPGIFNESGTRSSKLVNCSSLIESGLGQAPSEIPFILFVDLNVPFIPVPALDKPVMSETMRIIENLDLASVENPDKFSLLITTSFGFHYGDINKPALPPEHCDVLPKHTKCPLALPVLNDITKSLKRYGLIPEEV